MQRKEIWLKEGLTRFAEQGIDGVNIDELSKSIGIAKTSFYHFFKSKNSFLEKLFEKWENEGTVSIIEKLSAIDDPVKRFESVIKYVFKENIENEIFLIQLQRFAMVNPIGAKYFKRVKSKRMKFTLKFFTDMGLDGNEAEKKAMLWYTYATGRIFNKENKKFSKSEILSVIEELKYVTRISNNKGVGNA